ncbi:CopG family transcriptional regulator [Nitrosomonas sp. Is37]|uniref:ribbon-helix-helix domain-containing protein n=1 Tax=Nitrosomonas TaxID=914 RepID=UPI00294AFD68|nr:CopG family transcriptional regulator [Nitrosomonas sp. Is37]MDV6344764.1 CopG family transcriptional regulator [Nitrosomonas sp. Is37]
MKQTLMKRTQVYLSNEQEQALNSLALTSGRHRSELIREAINLLLSEKKVMHTQWKQALHNMKGMWAKDEKAAKRMQNIRNEFDR